MTVDAHPTTDADRERAQRECDHLPDLASIEADDTDTATGETMYVAECRYCMALITTPYTDREPETTAWTAPEGQWQ